MPEQITHAVQTTNLADILERVLDRGIVIAGDIRISLVDIELLNIKIRLLVASVEKAKEMGIDWWQSDPHLSSRAKALEEENRDLRDRLDRLEARISKALNKGRREGSHRIEAD
ncbi:MAG: gas vesicle protein [Candidatus Methylomirabilales bacterium]